MPGSKGRREKDLERVIASIIRSDDKIGMYFIRRFYWNMTPEACRTSIPTLEALLACEEVSDMHVRLDLLTREVDRYIRMTNDPQFSTRTEPYEYTLLAPMRTPAHHKILRRAVDILAERYARAEPKFIFQSFSNGERSGIWVSNQFEALNLEHIRRNLNLH